MNPQPDKLIEEIVEELLKSFEVHSISTLARFQIERSNLIEHFVNAFTPYNKKVQALIDALNEIKETFPESDGSIPPSTTKLSWELALERTNKTAKQALAAFDEKEKEEKI